MAKVAAGRQWSQLGVRWPDILGTAGHPAASEPSQIGIIHKLLYTDRRLGIALTIGAAALTGLLTTMAVPLGPATAGQALVVLVRRIRAVNRSLSSWHPRRKP